MSGSFAMLYYHLVFSTKNRAPLIPPELSGRLYAYIGGIVRRLDGVPLTVGGAPEHVHVLATLSRTRALSDMVRDIKANSSRWMSETLDRPGGFAWQEGFCLFTVGHESVADVTAYIQSQDEHHKRVSFMDEYRSFLIQHELDADEDRI